MRHVYSSTLLVALDFRWSLGIDTFKRLEPEFMLFYEILT